MATYVIGDIQGCFDELTELLELCAFSAGRDRLWLVGDLVNRGPKSLDTLRFVKGLGERAAVVLGNHDLHLIMRASGYGRDNKEDTIAPILEAEDRDELLAWLRQQPLMHVEDGYAMVHAGLLPQWSVAQAADLAAEVHAALQAENYVEFLANMWGSTPAQWDEGLQEWDRLRVIVNAMTRMRFCSADGVMEMSVKGPPDKAPAGCLPWFAMPGRASASHTIFCGHWSALGLHVENNLVALDSGCLWGGSLTAMRLEDRQIFQLPCVRQVKPTSWD